MRLSRILYLQRSDRIVLPWLIAVAACVGGIFLFSGVVQDEFVQGQAKEKGTYRQGKGRGKGDSFNGIASVEEDNRKTNLHPFDLNIASPDELIDLGFSDMEIQSVMKYRSKGGVYRRVEQLSKIRGMTKGKYDRLAPYFRVGNEYRLAADFVKMPQRWKPNASNHSNGSNLSNDSNPSNDSIHHANRQPKIPFGETVAINAADTTELKKIPGVGSIYAGMIVKYREKLGGFYAVEQLNDLQALPADIQAFLALDPVPLRKVKVNALPINKLILHPYISFYQARDIVDHIRKNGPLHSIRELQLSHNFTEEDIRRLEPYLEY